MIIIIRFGKRGRIEKILGAISHFIEWSGFGSVYSIESYADAEFKKKFKKVK